MELEKIFCPDITGRKIIPRSDLEAGDVVAFLTVNKGEQRTGLMVLSEDSSEWFCWAVNLFKEEGRVWTDDSLPQSDIIFFEATKAEKLYALGKALRHLSYDWHEEIINAIGDDAEKAFNAILLRIVLLTD